MIDEISSLCKQARSELRKGGMYHDFILIVDNLEKISSFEDRKEGMESHRHLFLDNYTQLTLLGAHVIYTIPLELARSTDAQLLKQRYGELFVLPMVKIFPRGKNSERFEAGWKTMLAMIEKRLPSGSLDVLFEPEAIEFLIQYSGGHARSLMSFVQEACTYVDDLPVTLGAAKDAIRQAVRIFDSTIPASYWSKLARLERSQDQKIDSADPDFANMLMNVIVLEYVNGESGTDIFESSAPWYAVHPIVRELKQFKEALAAGR
jgi:hypothetical protein